LGTGFMMASPPLVRGGLNLNIVNFMFLDTRSIYASNASSG